MSPDIFVQAYWHIEFLSNVESIFRGEKCMIRRIQTLDRIDQRFNLPITSAWEDI